MSKPTIIYHEEEPGWWAESDELHYCAAADSLTELRELVADGWDFYEFPYNSYREQLEDGTILEPLDKSKVEILASV